MLGRWRTTVLLGISTAAPDWPEQWQCRCRASGSALERLRGGRCEEEKMTGDGRRPAGQRLDVKCGGAPGGDVNYGGGGDRQVLRDLPMRKKKNCAGSCGFVLSAGFSRLFNVGPPKFCRSVV